MEGSKRLAHLPRLCINADGCEEGQGLGEGALGVVTVSEIHREIPQIG